MDTPQEHKPHEQHVEHEKVTQPISVDDVELEEGEVGQDSEEEGEIGENVEQATKSSSATTGQWHHGEVGAVAQTAPSGPRRPAVAPHAGCAPACGGSSELPATKSPKLDEAAVLGVQTIVMGPPAMPAGPRASVPPGTPRAIPTGPRAERERASVPPGTPRAIPTGPRAERERASVPPGTPARISVGGATPRTAPRAQNEHRQGASTAKRGRSPSPGAGSSAASSSKRFRWGNNQTKFEPVTYTPDPMGVQISELQQAAKRKDAKIESLEWQLARARAALHLVKKYGNSSDMSRLERTAKKYYFKNTQAVYPSDLSDVSDEEDGRNGTYIGPATGNEAFYTTLADEEADFYEATALDETVEGEAEHPDAVDQTARIDEQAAKSAATVGSLDAFIQREGLELEQDVIKSGPDHTNLYAKMFNLYSDGTYLPAPVGRFGQPFWTGSSWEDFDPRRLFNARRPDFVPVESEQFQLMACDAARIPFRFRSETQRMAVSWALLRNIPIVNAGLTPEPDVLTFCKSNSSYLPPVIRRQYRRNVKAQLYYVEYCAVDLENYIRLAQAGPQKTSTSSAYQAERSGWLNLLSYFVEWMFCNRESLPSETPTLYKGGIHPWPIQLADRQLYPDDMLELYKTLWLHLLRCGYNSQEILPGGELNQYLLRSQRLFHQSKSLTELYKEEKPDGPQYNQQQLRAWIADRLSYESIPANLPRVRVRLSRQRAERLQKKYNNANQSIKYNFLMV